MPAPALVKTWQFSYGGGPTSSLNKYVPSAGTSFPTNLLTDMRQVVFFIKSAMIGFASNPWTVAGSSDSVAAGMDAVDRWSAEANLVWASAGVAHSWIVLGQAGIVAGFQLLIDLTNGTDPSLANFYVSTAGFTGGSITARPTATDECPLGVTNTRYWTNQTGASYYVNVAQSSDGECTRIWGGYSGSLDFNTAPVASTLWIFDKPQNAESGGPPWVAGIINRNFATIGCSVSQLVNTAPSTNILRGRIGTTNLDFNMTCEITGTDLGQGLYVPQRQFAPGDLLAQWHWSPIGIWGETSPGRGRWGTLADIYWGMTGFDHWAGPSSPDQPYMRLGDTYPDSATRQWVQHGDMILPWNSAEGIPLWG